MPHFHFELHLTLVKFGEQPVYMVKQVMDIYMSVLPEIAYQTAKSYIEQGWRIERMDCRNFVWLQDITTTWND